MEIPRRGVVIEGDCDIHSQILIDSNVLEESFDIIVVSGENKLNQITRPSEKNPHLDPLTRFPKIPCEAL